MRVFANAKPLFVRFTVVLACGMGLLLSSPVVDTSSAAGECQYPDGDAGDIRKNEDGEAVVCQPDEHGNWRWTLIPPLQPRPLPPGFPTIDPPAQVAPPVPAPAPAPDIGGYCVGNYSVTVAMNPARSTSLLMDYGDTGPFAQPETRTIPQGTGLVTFRFSHEFNPSVFNLQPFLVQRATVMETGASGKAVTVHPQASPDQPPLMIP